MFVLILRITDPEDAGYFTNKTLNKLHGYLRHHPVKLALFFTVEFIKIYADNKADLDDLLANEAVCFDIKRHIFDAELSPVSESSILVLKRMHNTVQHVNKKVNQQLNYYKKHFSLDKEDKAWKSEQQELITYYQKQQVTQKQRKYFVIKNNEKCFTIWVEVRKIMVIEFEKTHFNSYGLLSIADKKGIQAND